MFYVCQHQHISYINLDLVNLWVRSISDEIYSIQCTWSRLLKWHCNMILHLRIIIIKAIIERCYLLLWSPCNLLAYEGTYVKKNSDLRFMVFEIWQFSVWKTSEYWIYTGLFFAGKKLTEKHFRKEKAQGCCENRKTRFLKGMVFINCAKPVRFWFIFVNQLKNIFELIFFIQF